MLRDYQQGKCAKLRKPSHNCIFFLATLLILNRFFLKIINHTLDCRHLTNKPNNQLEVTKLI